MLCRRASILILNAKPDRHLPISDRCHLRFYFVGKPTAWKKHVPLHGCIDCKLGIDLGPSGCPATANQSLQSFSDNNNFGRFVGRVGNVWATAGGDDGAAEFGEHVLRAVRTLLGNGCKQGEDGLGHRVQVSRSVQRSQQQGVEVPRVTGGVPLGHQDAERYFGAAANKLELQSVIVAGAEEKNPDDSLFVLTDMIPQELPGVDVIGKVNPHCSDGLVPYSGDSRDKLQGLASSMRPTMKIWDAMHADEDASGLTMAETIAQDINKMKATAFVYRQAHDSGVVGLIQSIPGDKWIGTANPKHYVMAHYSRDASHVTFEPA